jgi:hypothetical protein
MVEVAFNPAAINELADKVAKGLRFLSPYERALLLAIFAAAADRAKHISDDTARLRASQFTHPQREDRNDDIYTEVEVKKEDIEKLRRQLIEAYVPGDDFESVTEGEIRNKKIIGPPP